MRMSQVVELLQTLISNACVNDGSPESGNEARSVKTLQEFFGEDGEVVEPIPGRQSLVYRVAGSDPEAPSLALAPHLDVVPVNRDSWSVDPFDAPVSDGWVFGRGALDMLNVTSAMAVAARPYITGEKKPAGDLIFAAVADEESGGRYGAEALVKERWDLVGAEYLLTEVAYPPLQGAEGQMIPVSIGEKGPFWTVLRTGGTPGHGSAPYGADNALEKMSAALHGIFQSVTPVTITPEWREFVESLHIDAGLAQQLIDPEQVDEAIDHLSVTDPTFARYVHAATHLTVSPNRMIAGTKTNTIADTARAEVDIRALPGTGRNDIDVYLNKAMGSASDDVELEPVMDFDANFSTRPSDLWEVIANSVEAIEGHRRLVPAMMTVVTDARFWRAKGTIAYGVGLFDDRMAFSEMLALFHGNDERVSVTAVEKTLRLYVEILDRFGRT
jgi:acetylornithine deacetylase/succinyl-diaminopimelate desuccinylase-like protein